MPGPVHSVGPTAALSQRMHKSAFDDLGPSRLHAPQQGQELIMHCAGMLGLCEVVARQLDVPGVGDRFRLGRHVDGAREKVVLPGDERGRDREPAQGNQGRVRLVRPGAGKGV